MFVIAQDRSNPSHLLGCATSSWQGSEISLISTMAQQCHEGNSKLRIISKSQGNLHACYLHDKQTNATLKQTRQLKAPENVTKYLG